MIRLVYLYILTLPFFGFSFYNVNNRGIGRLDWILGILLLIIFGLRYINGTIKFAHSPVNKWMLIYIYSGLFSIINLFNAPDAQMLDFATKTIQLLMVTPIFFVISSLLIQKNELNTLLRTWVYSGFVFSIHTFYQLFAQVFDWPFANFTMSNPSISAGQQSARTLFGYIQPTSVFQEPSFLGSFLAPCLIIVAISLLTQQASKIFFKQQIQNWFLMFVIFVAVLLTNSQAALASVIVTFVFIYGSRITKRTNIIRLLLISVLVFTIAIWILSLFGFDFWTAFVYRTESLIENIRDLSSAEITSFANRYERSMAGISIWLEYPFFGIGLGSFGYNTTVHHVTNNAWIQVLVEQGLFGFVPLIICIGYICYKLWYSAMLLKNDPYWYTVLIAMLAVLVLICFDGLFTHNWIHPQRIFTLGAAHLVYIHTREFIPE